LKRDLHRNEKRPNNPVYEFESMSICKFAMLFEAYYKKTLNIDGGNDSENAAQEDDNEPKCISRQTSC
jgi:hypothetical protein